MPVPGITASTETDQEECNNIIVTERGDVMCFDDRNFMLWDKCAGPVCISSHLDDTFWDIDVGSLVWTGVRWQHTVQVGYFSFDAIGGWNINTFRPTRILVTLTTPDVAPEDIPLSANFSIQTAGHLLAQEIGIQWTSVNQTVILDLPMDWGPVPGGEFITRWVLDTDLYALGPYVECIQFV